MLTGIAVIELHVHDSHSLKAKRGVVRSLAGRLRNRFNVSVAETDHKESWQRAELGCCVVATDRRLAESVLSAADRLIEADDSARVVDSSTSFL